MKPKGKTKRIPIDENASYFCQIKINSTLAIGDTTIHTGTHIHIRTKDRWCGILMKTDAHYSIIADASCL